MTDHALIIPSPQCAAVGTEEAQRMYRAVWDKFIAELPEPTSEGKAEIEREVAEMIARRRCFGGKHDVIAWIENNSRRGKWNS